MNTIKRLLAGVSAAVLAVTGVALTGATAQAATAQRMFSYEQGWRVERHLRELADVDGDGNADIVGFGDAGTYVALGSDNNTFATPVLAVPDYGYDQGWRVDRHPRELADLNGDRRADIVGFGRGGTWISYGQVDGTFTSPTRALQHFGEIQGWRVDRHPRQLADVNGDQRPDIVGFGNAGTYVALRQGNNSFAAPVLAVADYGFDQGWRIEHHPRLLEYVNGDLGADIVGFGNAGTWLSSGQADGTFTDSVLAVADFGYAQGWRVERHPRQMADVFADGLMDIVGFGDAGTFVSSEQFDGTFADPFLGVADYGYNQGWRADQNPRELIHVFGHVSPEIIGFGDSGVYASYGERFGGFGEPVLAVPDFGTAQGWRSDRYPREVVDLNGNGLVEVVGFGHSATYVHTLVDIPF